MIDTLQANNQNITVLELRNYLLKPGMADAFGKYFDTHFVKPMTALGGHTLGQFKIKGAENRFVWMRGFTDMNTRLKFLNDFYIDSEVWKKFGPGANDMMINSDNVYLLRPLHFDNKSKEPGSMNSNVLKTGKGIIIVDFYVCNGTLDKAINLVESSYIRFLKSLDIHDITLWVSEMSENKFPRLPAFQDKNLLLTVTSYSDESEYQTKQAQIDSMENDPETATLKNSMLELITIQSQMILSPITRPI